MAVNGNGRVTLRDIMALQKEMYEKLDRINSELTNLKIKVAVISATVSTVIWVISYISKLGIFNG
ncbi:MAG TPA: hypothetical protein ENJ29_11960 [Bacteroidetes bacterium]|nr:hypothetical protein [Bacteroidota bacterium]